MKKETTNTKAILILLIPVFLLFIVRALMELNVIIRAKNAENYYKALIAKDYEKAYNHVFLWDTNPKEKSKNYTSEEGQRIYVDRLKKLEMEQNYRILKAKVTVSRYGAGEPLYGATLEVQVNGKIINVGESLEFVKGNKLWISNSRDANWLLRDGRMGLGDG
ncbi:hypothetical protein [Desnuesiella massiliensis]|uniref:hypothetical protein n=1 Tax=Desnuesiella massiliensis TaxID=1650662 RepID=UPI0006E22FA3|nr:hypothetical protein [Desnuesiella massiliensis]